MRRVAFWLGVLMLFMLWLALTSGLAYATYHVWTSTYDYGDVKAILSYVSVLWWMGNAIMLVIVGWRRDV